MTFLFWPFSRLPLFALQMLDGWLGALTAKVPGRYHDRLIANFCHAYPDVTPAMLKKAGRSAGRMVFEMSYFWVRKGGADVAPRLFDVCRTIVKRALADGHGLIFLTPHLGYFEVLSQAYVCEHPVTSLFKPLRRASLRGWIGTMWAEPNIQMAPADPRGVHMLVRTLKRGEAVGILPDQTPIAGGGVWAPFFSKPTYMMMLMHRLRRLTGASVVALFAERPPRGAGYRLYLEEIDDLPEDATQVATRINAVVERLIAVAPTQYLWGYNRYKYPKSVDAPPAA